MPTPTNAAQVGAAHIQGLKVGTSAFGAITFTNPDGTSMSGYVSPNLTSAQIKPSAKTEKVAGQDGYTSSLYGCDEMLEMTFDLIYEGDTIAHAISSAGLPQHLASAGITGFPVIPLGPFADGINTNGATTQPWFYESDAQVNAKNPFWDGSVTLRRYRKITSAAAIT
jgi:hypothetical protein